MRAWHFASLGITFAAGTFALSAQPAADAPSAADLRTAQNEARQATDRSRQFEKAAAEATDAATKARAQSEALAARIEAAEAEINASQTRLGLVDAQLSAQRARLAERQGPLIRLTAALQSLSRRPPALALVQPGSLDNMVRARAILAATLPRIRERTAAVSGEIARTRTLRVQQETARQALVGSRAQLAERREALTRMEADQRGRSEGFAALALNESDRALALGEEARRLETVTTDAAFRSELQASLARLPGPSPRPTTGAAASIPGPTFRLPAEGRVLTGVGELNDAGVHARGLALAVAADTAVRAPAGGRVTYAGPFRSYGQIVIVDHGEGWTSLVTNLAAIDVAVGQQIAGGTPIGRTGRGDAPRLAIELRYRGRPVPITALLAG